MLVIRLQRLGRKNDAQYRIVVQNSRNHPKRGKVIAYVGSYDPHSKQIELSKDEIQEYLNNGAQPSNRVALLLKSEGIKLPKWVVIKKQTKRETKNQDKLRKNQPVGPSKPAGKETKSAEATKPEAVSDEGVPKTEEKPVVSENQDAISEPEISQTELPDEAEPKKAEEASNSSK
jgi:small subunit ribosomal protein S16